MSLGVDSVISTDITPEKFAERQIEGKSTCESENHLEKKQMNVNCKLFVPETNIEKQNEADERTPEDFTENVDRVISKRVGTKGPDSKLTRIGSKELKVVMVKDLTLLIDRLLEDGSLCEKMALDE